MYRTPSSRKKKTTQTRLNLIPILDSVFIFIFFLLMSANFVNLFEITSDVPIVKEMEQPQKDDKKPLALTVKITKNGFGLYTQVPSALYKNISKKNEQYDFETLHQELIQLKKNHPDEKQVILDPIVDIEYGIVVKIMDAVRMLRESDETLYRENKNGITEKVNSLFDNIIFSNSM